MLFPYVRLLKIPMDPNIEKLQCHHPSKRTQVVRLDPYRINDFQQNPITSSRYPNEVPFSMANEIPMKCP